MFLPYGYRLGIDCGTNSMGYALVALNQQGYPLNLLHMGVRIFSDGREDKTKTSLAVARRDARGMRRRRDRFVRRQKAVMEHLVQSGLMPQDRNDRKTLEKLNPYMLRAKGLDHQLTLRELGRALFHLNQRRGFQSNRKQGSKDKEAGVVKAAHEALQNKMRDYRTYGEFLYHLSEEEKIHKQTPKRIRNRSMDANSAQYDFYPFRDELKNEYDALLTKQAEYYPELLKKDVVEQLKDIIFYQRALLPVKRGKCSLIPTEERAYAALPSSQRFRLLKEVNNLELLDRIWRRNQKALDQEQREIIVSELYKKKTLSFSSMRQKLKLDESTLFNLESEEREKLGGASTHIILAGKKYFGDIWLELNLEKQDEVVLELLNTEDENALLDWLKQKFPELSGEQMAAIMDAPLEEGTLRYSTEAIMHLLPYLEEGKNEHDAREACKVKGLFTHARGYDGRLYGDAGNPLPYYGELLESHVAFGTGNPQDSDEKNFGKINNPTVHIVLNQLRKLINELTPIYGKPKEIAVELARDLKLSKKEKKKLNAEIRKNTKANERYDDQIREILPAAKITTENRLRLKLHEQQQGICVYSGKAISRQEALSDKAEIDHILPFSRTLDDSTANKILVLRDANRAKRNLTPYEAFRGEAYEAILIRIQHLPGSKKWRFMPDAIDRATEGDKWLSRQLSDTQYMSRVAREYLRYVVGDKEGTNGHSNVDAYSGGLTAKLRHAWGLNNLLADENDAKNRDDHRHHAIDALVIACANRALLKQVSDASRKGEELNETWYKNLQEKAPPFIEFNRSELEKKLASVVISHKPDHGNVKEGGSTTGRLHEDTFYGKAKNQGKMGGREMPAGGMLRLHVRKPLISLKEKDIADIVDNHLRRKLAEAIGVPGQGKYEYKIALFAKEHNVHRVRVFVDKGEKNIKPIRNKAGEPYRYVATGSNHHIDIYCPVKDKPDMKIKAGQWCAEVISEFDANQKNFIPQWKKDHPAAKLVLRLHKNDMVAYDEQDGKRIICRVQKMSNKATGVKICLKPHADASTDDGWEASIQQMQKRNARKIAVTIAGKVLDPKKAPMPKPLRQVS